MFCLLYLFLFVLFFCCLLIKLIGIELVEVRDLGFKFGFYNESCECGV